VRGESARSLMVRCLVRVAGYLRKALSKTKFMRRCYTRWNRQMNVRVVFNQAQKLYHCVCNQVRRFAVALGMCFGLF